MKWRGSVAAWLVLALIGPAPAQALDEGQVLARLTDPAESRRTCPDSENAPFWTVAIATNPRDGYRLRFSRFGCGPGLAGAIVLAPGRSESSVEYRETAIDLIALGYGPVYVIDHRGQGLSPRLLPDPHKGHVESFTDYIDDLEAVLEKVQADLALSGAAPDRPLFFLSNSMGGAIGIGHLQRRGEASPFRAAALLGAMLHVNYLSYTGRDRSALNLAIYSERGARLQAAWRCGPADLLSPGTCEGYASPDTFGPYVPGARRFVPDTESIMTHSPERHALRTHVWDGVDWSDMAATDYEAGEIWTGPQLGGATARWVLEAARFNRDMRRPRNLARMTGAPVLLLTGTDDLRAYRPYARWRNRAPDLSRHRDFCDGLNAESLAQGRGYVCTFVPINGAFHELMKERDAERDVALETIDWFFRIHAR